MKLNIRKGEYLWTKEGYHLLDEKGFAVVADKDTTIDVYKKRHSEVEAIVRAERIHKGYDPDTGLPPSAAWQGVYEDALDAEVAAELDQEEAEAIANEESAPQDPEQQQSTEAEAAEQALEVSLAEIEEEAETVPEDAEPTLQDQAPEEPAVVPTEEASQEEAAESLPSIEEMH